MQEKFLNVKQVADILGLHVMTVYTKIRKGEIPAVKFGGTIRILEKELLKGMNDTS